MRSNLCPDAPVRLSSVESLTRCCGLSTTLRSMSVAVGVARWPRRALCATVALGLGLMCAVLALAAATTPMTGMTGMTDTSSVSAIAGTGVAAAAIAAGPAVDDFVSDAGPVMAAMCGDACVTEVGEACSYAAGLATITVLGLLLAIRPDTFMGTIAHSGLSVLARRPRRERTPWTALPRFSLCVLRV